MTTPDATFTPGFVGDLDLGARVDFRRRVRELEELAAAEGLKLPMPAPWIATLEALGCVVDLTTGKWTDGGGLEYRPAEAAYTLLEGGA